jgi:hypothetical protein
MFNSLFELPLVIVGTAIIGLLWLFALVGLALVRRYLLPRLRIRIEDSEFSGAMLQAVMVFYGLAVALIAVSVWQSYSDTAKLVSQEAASSPRSIARQAFIRNRSAPPCSAIFATTRISSFAGHGRCNNGERRRPRHRNWWSG